MIKWLSLYLGTHQDLIYHKQRIAMYSLRICTYFSEGLIWKSCTRTHEHHNEQLSSHPNTHPPILPNDSRTILGQILWATLIKAQKKLWHWIILCSFYTLGCPSLSQSLTVFYVTLHYIFALWSLPGAKVY